MGTGEVSAAVQAQYEAYAYPAPIDDLVEHARKGNYGLGDPSLFGDLLWPEGRPREDLRILVAGCGTNQAAHYAFTNPRSAVTGIDLSHSSLENQQRLKDKHGLGNLRLIKMNLEDISLIGEEFDLIISTGVLHHMASPEAGLKALSQVLSPTGVMFLMVYGASRRAGVYYLQDAFKRLGLGQNTQDISAARGLLSALPQKHYVKLFEEGASELSGDAAFVDAFMHPQDRAYSVSETIDFVRQGGLAFQGWFDLGLYSPDNYLHGNRHMMQMVAKLAPEDQWSVIDDLFLVHRTHYFMACHPDRNAKIQIRVSDENWLEHIPVRHPFFVQANSNTFSLTQQVVFQRDGVGVALSPAEAVFLSLMDGERTVSQILGAPQFSANDAAAMSSFARSFLSNMIPKGNVFLKTRFHVAVR